jgi:hypothetical protein
MKCSALNEMHTAGSRLLSTAQCCHMLCRAQPTCSCPLLLVQHPCVLCSTQSRHSGMPIIKRFREVKHALSLSEPTTLGNHQAAGKCSGPVSRISSHTPSHIRCWPACCGNVAAQRTHNSRLTCYTTAALLPHHNQACLQAI